MNFLAVKYNSNIPADAYVTIPHAVEIPLFVNNTETKNVISININNLI